MFPGISLSRMAARSHSGFPRRELPRSPVCPPLAPRTKRATGRPRAKEHPSPRPVLEVRFVGFAGPQAQEQSSAAFHSQELLVVLQSHFLFGNGAPDGLEVRDVID